MSAAQESNATEADWEITTSVGITALGVAAARAAETGRDDRLCRDPYAEPLVRAAGGPVELPTTVAGARECGWEADLVQLWEAMVPHVGVRTRFFDDYVTDAVATGVRQVVILAAGLDTRAHRLDWPAGTRVFELDQPRVLAFKHRVLADRETHLDGAYQQVGIDLRHDWPSALEQAGFDPNQPTVWLAEGLLPYLPEPAERALFAHITALSAPGSQLGLNDSHDIAAGRDNPQLRRVFEEFGLDPTSLWHTEPTRPNPAVWLGEHSWTVTETTGEALAERYQRPLSSEAADLLGNRSHYYIAHRSSHETGAAMPDSVPAAAAESDNGTGSLGSYTDTEWDIASGVGYTALAVAAGRAMETARPDALINDPQAAGFVHAAAPDATSSSLPTSWPPDPGAPPTGMETDTNELYQLWETMTTYLGVRSRFFDQYFHTACHEAGIRQVVLLAAGLDTRAQRLDWPAETTVFELDHANVLAFKERVLSQDQAQPGCTHRLVGVDLRHDWPSALEQAGFDPNQPTAWLAEGLLFFLPDEAKQLLSQRVHALSAPGSHWAIESIADPGAAMAAMQDSTVFRQLGAQFGADPTGLWPADQQWEPHAWLVRHGWTVTAASAHTVAARYQRVLQAPAPMANREHPSMLLTATYEHPPAGPDRHEATQPARPSMTSPGTRGHPETQHDNTEQSMTDSRKQVTTVATLQRLERLLQTDVERYPAPGGYLDTLPGQHHPPPPGWAQAAWQTVAGSVAYQRVLQPMMAASLAPSFRTVAGDLHLEPGQTIADVGCGPGNVTTTLADAVGPHGLAVGLDLSTPMLARAAAAARPNMGLIRADATRLPLRTGSVDAACATAVVMLLPDPADPLAELLRIVKPGGPLLAMVPARPTGRTAALTRPVVELFSQLGGARTFTPDEMAILLEQLGYQRIHTYQQSNMLTIRAHAPQNQQPHHR